MAQSVLNHEALKHNYSAQELINSLCQPVFDNFPIKNFWYIRLYPDSSFIQLSNDISWQQCCWENNYFDTYQAFCKINSFGNDLAHKEDFIINTEEMAPGLMDNASKHYNIFNNYNFITKQNDHLEILGFATNNNISFPTTFFAKNGSYLKLFGRFFREKAQHIIASSPLVSFKQKTKDHYQMCNNRSATERFLKAINYSRYSFVLNDKNIELSKREYETLLHYTQGKTAKEIGKDLTLSPRTIESYINNIKNKAGENNKAKIISGFLNYGLLKNKQF